MLLLCDFWCIDWLDLLRVEIITTATSWLALHKVVLSYHTLAHSTSWSSLLRTENSPVCIHYSGELTCVNRTSVHQVKLGVCSAFTTCILGLIGSRSCCLLRCAYFFRWANTLIHSQVVLVDMQRYALNVWLSICVRTRAISDILWCDNRLLRHGSVMLLLRS